MADASYVRVPFKVSEIGQFNQSQMQVLFMFSFLPDNDHTTAN